MPWHWQQLHKNKLLLLLLLLQLPQCDTTTYPLTWKYLCQYDKGRSWNGTASHIKPECIVNEWEGCNECDDKPGKSKWLHVWQYTTLYPRLPCRDEPCCSPTAPSVCGPAREDICVSPCLLSAPCRTARSTPTPALLVGAIFTNSCCGNGYSTVRGRQNNIFVIGLDWNKHIDTQIKFDNYLTKQAAD